MIEHDKVSADFSKNKQLLLAAIIHCQDVLENPAMSERAKAIVANKLVALQDALKKLNCVKPW